MKSRKAIHSVGGLFCVMVFWWYFRRNSYKPMRNIILVLAFLAVTAAQAQQQPTGAPAPSVFNYVEQMPQPPYDLGKYLSENIHYPDSARENNIEGRVIIRFVVNEDGHISDCAIVKSVSGDCDTEALRVIKNMPAWKPGRQNGKEVKVYYNQPISFKLEDPEPVKDTTKKNTVVKRPILYQQGDMAPDITPTPPPAMIYSYVEQPPNPTFDVNKYLRDHTKYPNEAKEKNVEGRVVIKFVVNEDGSISDVSVVRGIGAGCDEEAKRVVAAMPYWNAARQKGNKVKCYFIQTVTFKLTSGKW